MYNPQIEFTSKAEIKAYQEKELQVQLRYISKNSKFYQKFFQDNNIDISQIKTLEDLRKIPFTTKKDLQLYGNDFLCVEPRKIIDYITTSGTLGNPVTFAMTENDLQRLAYNEEISWRSMGFTEDDVVQLMVSLDKRFMAGLAYFMGLRNIGCGIVRVGNGIPQMQWDTIERIKPTAIICIPSFILHLIDYAEQHGIDYKNSSIKKIVCLGEALRDKNFEYSMLAKQIKSKWDVELFSTYASTEMANAFCECPQKNGGHHHPELIIAEFVDKDGNPVGPKEEGELVITPLGVEAMPLLRFKTGDICYYMDEPCKCGRNTFRISPVLGRLNQMIKYRGTTLYPPAIFDVLDNQEYIENYYVECSLELGLDKVSCYISLKREIDEKELKELKDKFRSKIRVVPDIHICSSAEVAEVVTPKNARKPIKFIDKR